MNDPNTGQFMWGDVIQDLIRNYMMMQMMKGNKKTTQTPGQTQVPQPNIGGGINPPPGLQQQAPGSMQPQPFPQGQSPGMGAPPPGGPGQMPNLPPQLMQLIIQLLQQSQMGR